MPARWTKNGRVKGTGDYDRQLDVRISKVMHARLLMMAEEEEATASAVVRRALAREISQWARELENHENVAV